jgi:predicted nucleic acid-binding protein
MITVLDTGGVEGLAPIDERRRARLRVLMRRGDDLVLPAAVLAESVLTGHRGHDYHVQRLLDLVEIVQVDAAVGYAAGLLRRQVIDGGGKRAPSGVDAIVAASADARAGDQEVLIITSDRGDFERLATVADNGSRISLQVC